MTLISLIRNLKRLPHVQCNKTILAIAASERSSDARGLLRPGVLGSGAEPQKLDAVAGLGAESPVTRACSLAWLLVTTGAFATEAVGTFRSVSSLIFFPVNIASRFDSALIPVRCFDGSIIQSQSLLDHHTLKR
jgi:hypothetical protein